MSQYLGRSSMLPLHVLGFPHVAKPDRLKGYWPG